MHRRGYPSVVLGYGHAQKLLNRTSGHRQTIQTSMRQTSEQSESWLDHRECSCDMRVSFSLLADSQDDGPSPWDAAAIGLQVVGTMDRLVMYWAEGRSKRHLGRSEKGAELFLPKRRFIESGKAGVQSWSNVAQLYFTHCARIDADRAKC